MNNTRRTNAEEIAVQIERLDPNTTGLISFQAYMRDLLSEESDVNEATLSLNLLETLATLADENEKAIEKRRRPVGPEDSELTNLYRLEKNKWKFVSNSSQTPPLNYEQFYTFVHSEEFAHVKRYQDELTFMQIDTNRNDYIEIDEFLYAFKSKTIFFQKKYFNQFTIKSNSNL